MTQGPFRGVASALSRVFGGTVTLHPGQPEEHDVTAIFRRVPRRVTLNNGTEMETLVPVLRATREIINSLGEGNLIDPKDGKTYEFLFSEESEGPASDGLVTAQLGEVEV